MADGTTSIKLRRARYERALWWLDKGVSVVPIKPRSKHLYRGYGANKAHIDDADVACERFLGSDDNLGVVLGGEIGLIVADWDDVRDFSAWHGEIGERVHTLTEITARGYHLFFFCKDLSSAAGNGCEIKSRGVCVAAPSAHPRGTVYRVAVDAPILHIDGHRANALFPFLSEGVRPKVRGGKGDVVGCRSEKQITQKVARGGIIDRIKEARTIVEEMQAAGVELQPVGDDTLVGLCPFHDDHHPSLWVYPRRGLWGCNKPDCPAAGIHDVINFRALARGTNNSMAIRQLAQEFLDPLCG